LSKTPKRQPQKNDQLDVPKTHGIDQSLYNLFFKLANGSDLLEIFGETGSGKTTLCNLLCEDAVSKKKKVLYIDDEKNFHTPPTKFDYILFDTFEKMYDYVIDIKKNYDLVVLDSLGLPILGWWAKSKDMRKKGDILAKCSAIAYSLKTYAIQKKAIVVMTNQPESSFMKDDVKDESQLREFGDKHRFFVKDSIRSSILQSKKGSTICSFKASKMRDFGKGEEIILLEITNDYKRAAILIPQLKIGV